MIYPANLFPASFYPIGWSFQGLGAVVQDFLILGGTLVVPVQEGRATKRPASRRGVRARTNDGRLHVRVWGGLKEEIEVTTGPLTDAEVATLKAMVPVQTMLVAGGTLIGGIGKIVNVRITQERYLQDGLGYQRELELRLSEV